VPNSNSPKSRRQRQESARRWEQEQIESGGRRITVMLTPPAAEKLRRLTEAGETVREAVNRAILVLD